MLKFITADITTGEKEQEDGEKRYPCEEARSMIKNRQGLLRKKKKKKTQKKKKQKRTNTHAHMLT